MKGSSTLFGHSDKLVGWLAALSALFLGFLLGGVIVTDNPYFLLAVAAGVGLVGLCLKWPNIVILLALSSPLVGWLSIALGSLAGINIYVGDVFKVLLLLWIALAAWQHRLEWPRSALLLPLVCFMMLVGVGGLVGAYRGYPIKSIFRDTSVLLGYVMVLVGYNLVRDRLAIRRWALAFLLVGMLTAAYAIAMRVLGIESEAGFAGEAVVSTRYGLISRAYGLPGTTYFYILALYLSIAFLIERVSLRSTQKLALGIAGTVCFMQVLLLFGRSLFLGVVAGTGLMAAALPTTRRFKFALAGAAVAALPFFVAPALHVPLTAEMTDRFLSIIDRQAGGKGAQANIQGRQDELRGVWEALSLPEKFVGRGIGARLFVTIGEGYGPMEVEAYHNSIAITILTIGLVGVIIYVWLMVRVVREARETLRWQGDPRMRAWYIAFVASFVAVAIWGLGTYGMPMNPNIPGCTVLGIALRCRELLRADLGGLRDE